VSSLFLRNLVEFFRFILRDSLWDEERSIQMPKPKGEEKGKETYSSMNQIDRSFPFLRPDYKITLFLPLPLLPRSTLTLIISLLSHNLHSRFVDFQPIRPNLFDSLRDFWLFEFLDVLTTLLKHWTEGDEGTPERRVVR